ncbi:MAG: methyltransferase domain-containing protein [Bacteroidetes bacterium]|jgi:thiopurine S-methyltransferase|nr:methyltransferase domain-containing protein [Bacteroidota bacterium]
MNEKYWENRYLNNHTGWDMNQVSPPLKVYIDHIENKNLKILIPGAGNAYEAEYLLNMGFKKVYVADIAKTPLNNLKHRVPSFPDEQLLHINFFDIQLKFDLIFEQTFFCALRPELRFEYVKKMHKILEPNGRLVGVFFDFPLTEEGPPFGGSKEEYLSYFKNYFKIKTLERCYNSHPKRQGKELFFNFKKNVNGL